MADNPPTTNPTPPASAPPVAAAAAATPAVAAKPHEKHRPAEMHFGSYPLFVMFWPLVLGGEICAWLIHWRPLWSENVTWVYITILLTCCVTTGFDVRRNLAIGWILFVALCWVAGLYLRDAQHIPVLSDIKQFLANFDATVSPGFLHAVSLLFLIGLIGVLINVFLNHRWRVTHNELHLFRHGEGEDAITRGAKRISVEFPDVFELLILGAGHVVVRDSKGKEEIRRIPRVPMLLFREKELDAIAEVWAVTTQSESGASEDEET
jgi:hypothetical protein